MNFFLLILILFSTVACSSTKKNEPNKNTYVHPTLQPYVDNWKEQHIDWKQMHPDYKEGSILPFTFDPRMGNNVVGRCQMHPDLNKRELFISRTAWEMYPAKREKYVIHLMNLCLNGDKRSYVPYGDFPYYGF